MLPGHVSSMEDRKHGDLTFKRVTDFPAVGHAGRGKKFRGLLTWPSSTVASTRAQAFDKQARKLSVLYALGEAGHRLGAGYLSPPLRVLRKSSTIYSQK